MTTNKLGHLEGRLQQLEREMLREQRFLHSFIEQANVMVIALDRDGRVTIFNRKAETETGYSREEVLGSMLSEAFPAEAGNTMHALAEHFKVSGKRGFRCETQLVTKAGLQRRIVWNASCLRDGEEVVGLMAFGDDLTSLKQEEDRTRWFDAMEVLQRFAGKLAHDFNNLLGTVLGYASMLRTEAPQGSSEREYAENVVIGIKRCAVVLKRLLDFGCGGPRKAAAFELGDVVRRAVARLRADAPSGVELAFTPADKAMQVSADAAQLEVARGEVIRNAFEAMPEGGRVEVATGTAFADEAFCGERPGLVQGWHATVRVTDTGPGILPEDALRLLEPFKTTKQERCSGLGLPMAYGILRQNGGWVELAGKPGAGTSVTMYLPLDASRVEETAPKEHGRNGPRTVLVVDDEDALVETVSEMLKHLGYLVLTAGDGEEAIRIYNEHKSNVDLIVLDMIMPRKSGREAYKDLKKIQPEVKVLFTSGFDGQKAVAEAMCQEGAAGFVEKPYHLSDLTDIIKRIVEERSSS